MHGEIRGFLAEIWRFPAEIRGFLAKIRRFPEEIRWISWGNSGNFMEILGNFQFGKTAGKNRFISSGNLGNFQEKLWEIFRGNFLQEIPRVFPKKLRNSPNLPRKYKKNLRKSLSFQEFPRISQENPRIFPNLKLPEFLQEVPLIFPGNLPNFPRKSPKFSQ